MYMNDTLIKTIPLYIKINEDQLELFRYDAYLGNVEDIYPIQRRKVDYYTKHIELALDLPIGSLCDDITYSESLEFHSEICINSQVDYSCGNLIYVLPHI